MASSEEAIASEDPEVIKKRRSTIQGSMTTIRKRLGKLLSKSAGNFDHVKIKRLRVQDDYNDLKKLLESFKVIHEAYQHFREVGKDDTQEEALVERQDQHYDEVVDNVYEIFELYADYEKSYKIYQAGQPDPELAKKEAEERSSKEALAKQLKQEEEVQKQEAEAVAKAKKELRATVVKKEKLMWMLLGCTGLQRSMLKT